MTTELVGVRAEMTKVAISIEHITTRNGRADEQHVDYEARLRTLEKIDIEDLKGLKGRVASLEKSGGWRRGQSP